MRIATTLLFALVLLAIGVIGGHTYRASRDQAQIQAATSNTAVCTSALASKQAAVDDVGRRLADLRERHRVALDDARRVLGERDSELADLRLRVATSTHDIRTAAHADANCAALARLPVCSAVAGRLWPARDATADRHAN